MSNATDVLAWLPAWFSPEQIHTVLVAFPDVWGRLLGKRLTRSHFLQTVAHAGTHACNYLLTVDMEMNPLEGFKLASWEQGYGDFHLKPHLSTLRALPWDRGAALVLCDLEHEDGRPVAEAPRSILTRQVERLRQRGLSAYMGSELEFYLFDESYEAASAARYAALHPSSDYLIDYHLLQTGRDEPLLRRLRNEMHDAGITVEGSKGEWGRGQHELNLLFCEALEMADRHVVFKHAAREIAAQQSRSITFMAKLAADQAGSSFHLHSSLWDAEGTRSRFIDRGGEPSKEFRFFLGGLMKYARELSYFFAPTVNSYKRFQAASWAPTSLVWAHDNRTTAFRVVGHGNSLRVENRAPGADANPYLAFAATLVAGLRGIDDHIDCGEPFTGNAYLDRSLPRLPRSLDEAAELLDGSTLAREALGDQVVDFYVHTARLECQAYQAAVTDWERQRYFERI
jgi:glutamine synthetase